MDTVQIGSVAALCILHLKTKKRRCRRYWVHPVLSSRLTTGHFHLNFSNHRKYPEKFFSYYRMSIKSFDKLLSLIEDEIKKQDTHLRLSIGPTERLVITLRYLATGSSFSTLEYQFQVAKSTVGQIVKETCKVIWRILQPLEMPVPTEEKWIEISERFYKQCHFPNCLGAIDGKHVRIISPKNSGSTFFNYKKYFSIVLLGVADSDYCFTAIDVGSYGRESDSNIFKNSIFGKLLRENKLDIPGNKPLPNTDNSNLPFVFVADEAFGLDEHLLRPYPRANLNENERIFNYRLTVARRMVECTFGILASKWRIFQTGMLVDEQFAEDITKAACVLNNFVRRRDGYDFDATLVDSMESVAARGTGGPSSRIMIRNKFMSYFVSPLGEIPWQYNRI